MKIRMSSIIGLVVHLAIAAALVYFNVPLWVAVSLTIAFREHGELERKFSGSIFSFDKQKRILADMFTNPNEMIQWMPVFPVAYLVSLLNG